MFRWIITIAAFFALLVIVIIFHAKADIAIGSHWLSYLLLGFAVLTMRFVYKLGKEWEERQD